MAPPAAELPTNAVVPLPFAVIVCAGMKTRVIEDNADFDGLVYVLSHDLRAPARALRQYVLLLQDESGDQLSGTAKRFMDRLGQVLDRMDQRLDAILELSRFGRPNGAPEDIDIGELAANAFGERGITADIAPDLPTVRADRGRIEWLVGALADNVLHHAQGAPVRVEFDGERFVFRDSGPGIPEHIAHEVFMVFRPVPHPSTPRQGMGLSSCSRIVRSLGGGMTVECPADGGTHVYFGLPLA